MAFDRQANTGISAEDLALGFGLRPGAQNGVGTYFYKALASYLFPTGTYVGIGFERSNYGYASFVPPSVLDFYPKVLAGTMRQSGAMASLAQPFGRATVMMSAGALWDLSNPMYGRGSDYRATQFSFGGKYAFNDTFGVYAYYSVIQNRQNQNANLGAPLYTNNLGTPRADLASGDRPRAFGVGAIAHF